MQRTSAQNRSHAVPVEHQTAASGLEHFYGQILQDYAKTLHPELSASKIALSIVSLGLLPLFVLIVSIINSTSAYFLFRKIIQREATLDFLKSGLSSVTSTDEDWKERIYQKNLIAEFEQENDRLKEQFHALTAAVPFKTPPDPKPKPQVDSFGDLLQSIEEAEAKGLQDFNNNGNAATSAKESLTTVASSTKASATAHLPTSTQPNLLLSTKRIEALGLPKGGE